MSPGFGCAITVQGPGWRRFRGYERSRGLVRLLVSRHLALMRRHQGGISFGPEPTAADLAAAFGLSRTGPGNAE